MYVNITVAARELNMSREWLYQLIRKDEISTVEIAGRRVVVKDSRFEQLKRIRSKRKE